MHRYVTEFGQPLPKNDDDERRATSYMDRVEAEEKLRDALAKRDVANCPLRYKMAWAGPAALCELTGLRYWECCGKVTGSVKSEAELPVQLQHDRWVVRDASLVLCKGSCKSGTGAELARVWAYWDVCDLGSRCRQVLTS